VRRQFLPGEIAAATSRLLRADSPEQTRIVWFNSSDFMREWMRQTKSSRLGICETPVLKSKRGSWRGGGCVGRYFASGFGAASKA